MARVLIVSLVYQPDIVSTATLAGDLARGLQDAGHQVTVVTSIPHYNPASSIRSNPAYVARWWRPLTEQDERGVRVLRVYMPRRRRWVWARAFDFLLFQTLTTLATIVRARAQDVIFVISPPITLGLSGVLLARLSRARLVYNVQELWPDVPVHLGIIRNSLLVRTAYALERWVYRRADAISSIARSFNRTLADRGVSPAKLHFIPNFVDIERLVPGEKDNAFAREHGLSQAFVALYAGNIGMTQGLEETLVDAARALRDEAGIQILIVGDGVKLPQLRQALSSAGLANVRLLPFQPAERVGDVYATADVCLAPLKAGFAYATAPSKVYTALAAGRPVIVAAEADSETATVVTEAQAGIVVTPQSVPELIAAIRTLAGDPARGRQLGTNGREWITRYYSRAAVLAQYDTLIRELSP